MLNDLLDIVDSYTVRNIIRDCLTKRTDETQDPRGVSYTGAYDCQGDYHNAQSPPNNARAPVARTVLEKAAERDTDEHVEYVRGEPDTYHTQGRPGI